MFDKIAKAILAAVLAFATALAGIAIEPGPAGTVQLITAVGTAIVAGVSTWALPNSSLVSSTKALVAGALTIAAGLITGATGHNLTWQQILAVVVAGVITAGAVHATPMTDASTPIRPVAGGYAAGGVVTGYQPSTLISAPGTRAPYPAEPGPFSSTPESSGGAHEAP